MSPILAAWWPGSNGLIKLSYLLCTGLVLKTALGLERVSCSTLVAACVFLLSDFFACGSITPLRAGCDGVSRNEADISLLL